MNSKKRSFNQLQTMELSSKFRSKQDLHKYLTEKVRVIPIS